MTTNGSQLGKLAAPLFDAGLKRLHWPNPRDKWRPYLTGYELSFLGAPLLGFDS